MQMSSPWVVWVDNASWATLRLESAALQNAKQMFVAPLRYPYDQNQDHSFFYRTLTICTLAIASES